MPVVPRPDLTKARPLLFSRLLYPVENRYPIEPKPNRHTYG